MKLNHPVITKLKVLKYGVKTIVSHYKTLGFNGVVFLLRKSSRKNALLEILIPGHAQPIYLRNSTADIAMFYLVNFDQDFNFDYGASPRVIVDCGAHIGLTAVYFANKYPGVKIYCIEPEKSNFDLLVKNTAAYKNIECLNYGVWNKTTHLKIADEGFGNWGFITKEVANSDTDTIPAISIGDVVDKYNIDQIDICKINIEGSETEVFSDNFTNWLPKTKLIMIELHDRIREGCTHAFFKAMLNYKFEVRGKGPYLICTLNNQQLTNK